MLSSIRFEDWFAGTIIILMTFIVVKAVWGLNLKTMFTTKNDPSSISHTRFWSNMAYFVATITFVKLNFRESEYITELWLIYLGIIGGNASINKYISMKYGGNQRNPTPVIYNEE